MAPLVSAGTPGPLDKEKQDVYQVLLHPQELRRAGFAQ